MFLFQGKDRIMSALRGLLQDLGAELRDERIEPDSEAKAKQGRAAEVRMANTHQACVSLLLCVRLCDTAGSPADDPSPWPHVLPILSSTGIMKRLVPEYLGQSLGGAAAKQDRHAQICCIETLD